MEEARLRTTEAVRATAVEAACVQARLAANVRATEEARLRVAEDAAARAAGVAAGKEAAEIQAAAKAAGVETGARDNVAAEKKAAEAQASAKAAAEEKAAKDKVAALKVADMIRPDSLAKQGQDRHPISVPHNVSPYREAISPGVWSRGRERGQYQPSTFEHLGYYTMKELYVLSLVSFDHLLQLVEEAEGRWSKRTTRLERLSVALLLSLLRGKLPWRCSGLDQCHNGVKNRTARHGSS